MPIHITMADAITRGAKYLLSHQGVNETEQNIILEATKYNLLVKTFNGSSVLLVASVVSAVFLAMTSSFVFLALGLFLRYTTEKELNHYSVPPPVRPKKLGEDEHNLNLTHSLRHILSHETKEERIHHIFVNVKLDKLVRPEYIALWEPHELFIFGFSGWMNSIDIPDEASRAALLEEQASQATPKATPRTHRKQQSESK